MISRTSTPICSRCPRRRTTRAFRCSIRRRGGPHVRPFRQPRGSHDRALLAPRPEEQSLRAPLQRFSHRHDSLSAPAFELGRARARRRALGPGAALVEGGEAAENDFQRAPGGGCREADVARCVGPIALPHSGGGLVRVAGAPARRSGAGREPGGEKGPVLPPKRKGPPVLPPAPAPLGKNADRPSAPPPRAPHPPPA